MFCPLNGDDIQAQTSVEYVQSFHVKCSSGFITIVHMSNNCHFAVSLPLVFFCLFA